MMECPSLGLVVERMKNECTDPTKLNLITLKNSLFYIKQYYPNSSEVEILEIASDCIWKNVMAIIKMFETDKKEILKETIDLINRLKRKVEELQNAAH